MVTGVRYNALWELYTLLFLFSLSSMFSHEITATKSCAYFSFETSTVHSNSVEVTENMTVTLMFYLKSNTCSNMENTVITIRRLDLTTNSYTPQCDIVLKNNTCRSTTHEHVYCGCLNTVGAYTFSKIVIKSDITRWKWTTKNGLADDFYIWFNETLIEWDSAPFSSVDDQILPLSSSSSSLSTSTTIGTTHVSSSSLSTSTTIGTTHVSSQDDKAYKEMQLIFITVGACLIILICSLVIVIYLQKKGQQKVKTPRM